MKKPESKSSAAENVVRRIHESGGGLAAYLRNLHRILAEPGSQAVKERASQEFDDVVRAALTAGRERPLAAPASKVSRDADEDWKRFEKKLEQDIIRKMKL
jgi:hypothetical protein